ncbi:Uncharacterised protein [Vibrio cholerae]|uniref:Uncharacterized protein n=1 Tax=Vibrio cholerae TaxID=666 RepID=A0A655WW57_VIBCL|nr:Uncharacterised protein [Vibrio cholerae]
MASTEHTGYARHSLLSWGRQPLRCLHPEPLLKSSQTGYQSNPLDNLS